MDPAHAARLATGVLTGRGDGGPDKDNKGSPDTRGTCGDYGRVHHRRRKNLQVDPTFGRGKRAESRTRLSFWLDVPPSSYEASLVFILTNILPLSFHQH